MTSAYTVGELEEWDERIRARAEAFGLDCRSQEFELCDHNQMLTYMAYSGMPAHYPHWSYGKAYEKLKTLYDHGVSGLPYEMVINSDPALAYLMRDNSLLLQILTIAHVYGHNDFFKNNATFRSTRPEFTLATFKAHGERVRSYIEDPSIGLERVEGILDAAHAVSLQCRRNLAVRKLTEGEQRLLIEEAAEPAPDPFRSVHRARPYREPDLHKEPPAPEEDLLLFIRDHNPYLAGWEKDLLTIVHEQARYFIPQIETKIMNEGWATYWHRRILESLDLPQKLHLEFLVRHNQVVRPFSQGINPYHLGMRVWEDLRRRYDDPDEAELNELDPLRPSGDRKIFEVRESDRDVSFLRRHLTERLTRELNLFEYEARGENLVVSRVPDREGWRRIRETLIRNAGMNTVPVVKIEDADYGQKRILHLKHYHDGRDLQLKYAEKTLGHIRSLWRRDVVLETSLNGQSIALVLENDGFSTRHL